MQSTECPGPREHSQLPQVYLEYPKNASPRQRGGQTGKQMQMAGLEDIFKTTASSSTINMRMPTSTPLFWLFSGAVSWLKQGQRVRSIPNECKIYISQAMNSAL